MRLALTLALCAVATVTGAVSGTLIGTARAADPAAEPPLPPSLAAILARPDHIAALQRATRAVDLPGKAACPTANYVTTGDVGVLLPFKTDEKGQIIGGMIKESVRETGCGSDRLLNALTSFEPGGSMQTEPLLPGSTITDPQLQHDSVPYAAGALGQMPTGCEQGNVSNTRFVGLDGRPPGTRPTQGTPPAPWTEIWTLQACAKRSEVAIHFTPDPTGTEIRAEPVK